MLFIPKRSYILFIHFDFLPPPLRSDVFVEITAAPHPKKSESKTQKGENSADEKMGGKSTVTSGKGSAELREGGEGKSGKIQKD